MKHKAKLETTNGGNVFADCSCGAQLGVYRDRTLAREAVKAHAKGRDTSVGKVGTYVLYGPSPRGM